MREIRLEVEDAEPGLGLGMAAASVACLLGMPLVHPAQDIGLVAASMALAGLAVRRLLVSDALVAGRTDLARDKGREHSAQVLATVPTLVSIYEVGAPGHMAFPVAVGAFALAAAGFALWRSVSLALCAQGLAGAPSVPAAIAEA